MFKGIIFRAEGTPWPPHHMTSAKWMELEPTTVRIASLIATQDGIYLHGLKPGGLSYSGDELPHVVGWQGELYLEDGHHRAVRHMIAGRKVMLARVLWVLPEPEGEF